MYHNILLGRFRSNFFAQKLNTKDFFFANERMQKKNSTKLTVS